MWDIINKIFPIGAMIVVDIICIIGIVVLSRGPIPKEVTFPLMCLFALVILVLPKATGIVITEVLQKK